MNEVTIKSSRSDYELRLSGPRPGGPGNGVEYLRVSITGHDLMASSSEIYMYGAEHLADFFEDLAANWKGWEGEKERGSIEGDFNIIATADQLGHIELRIQLRSGPYSDAWSVETCIDVDAGQIEQIAKEVKRFLRL
jgi:hypothetical protein